MMWRPGVCVLVACCFVGLAARADPPKVTKERAAAMAAGLKAAEQKYAAIEAEIAEGFKALEKMKPGSPESEAQGDKLRDLTRQTHQALDEVLMWQERIRRGDPNYRPPARKPIQRGTIKLDNEPPPAEPVKPPAPADPGKPAAPGKPADPADPGKPAPGTGPAPTPAPPQSPPRPKPTLADLPPLNPPPSKFTDEQARTVSKEQRDAMKDVTLPRLTGAFDDAAKSFRSSDLGRDVECLHAMYDAYKEVEEMLALVAALMREAQQHRGGADEAAQLALGQLRAQLLEEARRMAVAYRVNRGRIEKDLEP